MDSCELPAYSFPFTKSYNLVSMNNKQNIDLPNTINHHQNGFNLNLAGLDKLRPANYMPSTPQQQIDPYQYLAYNSLYGPQHLSPPPPAQICSSIPFSALTMFNNFQPTTSRFPFNASAASTVPYQSNNMQFNFDNQMPTRSAQQPNYCNNNVLQQQQQQQRFSIGDSGVDFNNSGNQIFQNGLQRINTNNSMNNILNDFSGACSGMNVMNSNNKSMMEKSVLMATFENSNDSDYGILSNSDHSNTSDSSPNSSFEKNGSNDAAGLMKDSFNKIGTMNDSDPLHLDEASKLARLAMRGGKLAEKFAQQHRHRPCFKKIDSLCARMKQDLLRPNGVLPNINSQGYAWAVKDLIFVFTRVMNAWIIVKGYVYNIEGLDKIKNALCPDFDNSFFDWQEQTRKFSDTLIRSFIGVHLLTQNQKTFYQKSSNNNGILNNDNCGDTTTSTTTTTTNSTTALTFAELMKNLDISKIDLFDDTLFEKLMLNDLDCDNNCNCNGNTENLNLNNGIIDENKESILKHDYLLSVDEKITIKNKEYLKTGVYDPIGNGTSNSLNQNDPIDILFNNNSNSNIQQQKQQQQQMKTFSNLNEINNLSITNENTNNLQWQNIIENNIMPSSLICNTDNYNIDNLNNSNLSMNGQQQQQQQQQELIKSFNMNSSSSSKTSIIPTNNYKFHIVDDNPLAKLLNSINPNAYILLNSKLMEKLEVFLEHIGNLSVGKYFFTTFFAKNYFPDFLEKYPNFNEIRSINLKLLAGGYTQVYEIVHDLKVVIYNARQYLKTHNDEFLKKTIRQYEVEINDMLNDEIFNNYNFDHITGNPDENLFNF